MNEERSADRAVAAPDGGQAVTVGDPVAAAVLDAPVEAPAAVCVGAVEALSSLLLQAITAVATATSASRQTRAEGRLRASCLRFPPCLRAVFNSSVGEPPPNAGLTPT